MHTVDVVTVIPATIERTWAALCDTEHWSDWQPISSVTVGAAAASAPGSSTPCKVGECATGTA